MRRCLVVKDGVTYARQCFHNPPCDPSGLPENQLGGYNWRKRVAASWWRERAGVMIDHSGSTRLVFLTRNYAIKIPDPTCAWRLFLSGLLANMQEREFSGTKWPKLCPVVFSIPGGWLVVMRRAAPLSEAEFTAMDKNWLEEEEYVIPAEFKQNSFGWIDGRIVAVDYGN